MNSKQRRTGNRHWPYDVVISASDERLEECFEWLTATFGSNSFKRRQPPQWFWRNEYTSGGNFTMYGYGARVFFRRERDYAAFLLRWEP